MKTFLSRFTDIYLSFLRFFYHNNRLRDVMAKLEQSNGEKKIVKQKKEICMLKRGSNFKSHKLFLVLCFAFQFALYFKCKFVCVNSRHLFPFIHLFFLFCFVCFINQFRSVKASTGDENQWLSSCDNLQAF